jgi:signal transduction histidine kinase
MPTVYEKHDVPKPYLEKWQKTVNLLAGICQVPAGLIMRVWSIEIEVLVASQTEGNPYKPGEKVDLNTGLYCETVMATRSQLLIPNALEDPVWKDNPDVALNMISYLGIPLIWPDGQVFGTICVLDDNTRYYSKLYQDLLWEFKTTIESDFRLILERAEMDAFAHTVAHDLKNPLARIVGFAQLLVRDRLHMSDDELLHWLEVIAETGYKMSDIIDELLLLSYLRREEQIDVEILNMTHIVREAWDRLGGMIERRDAEILLPKRWPEAVGYGPWVEEVWVNYLSNALKYGGRPPRIELGATRQADSKIRFWVCDNGPGILPKDQERLFTPFTRLEQTHVEGHGLGLSIVQRIMERLGGDVGVESQVGHGSTFYFILPGACDA